MRRAEDVFYLHRRDASVQSSPLEARPFNSCEGEGNVCSGVVMCEIKPRPYRIEEIFFFYLVK